MKNMQQDYSIVTIPPLESTFGPAKLKETDGIIGTLRLTFSTEVSTYIKSNIEDKII